LAEKIQIVVAGASGYIGKEVISKILERFPAAEITALSRSQQKSEDERLVWKPCDLFSLKSLEQALPKKVDYGIYLVHSMGPTAQLDQGSFADYDLILADNFARSMATRGLKHLVYLSGLIPEAHKLSLHLQSREEVEQVFHEYSMPTTIFRAGLILGEAGSSFQILIKLVKRLPVMVCPKWTRTLTTPVDLETVLFALTSSLGDQQHIGKTYDLAGCAPLTYVNMMKETAKEMGLKRMFLTVPFFTPTLSRLWVSLITNSSKDLVYPLIESLEHPMLARPQFLFPNIQSNRSYRELLKRVSFRSKPGRSFFRFQAQRKTVRSVQRLTLPKGKDASWIRDQYFSWLPRFFSPLIGVRRTGLSVVFSLLENKVDLLELQPSPERSSDDRQLLYITKGLLVAQKNRGRLEFRVVLNRRYVLAAIHDFQPALPWFLYKYTQALIHLFVMNAFSKFLAKQSKD
jgi:uncharacterized protein YbjT (DUF2867 family)